MNLLESELYKAASHDELIDFLCVVENDSFDEVVEQLISLNNDGQVNLVTQMMELTNSVPHQFFWLCHIFESVLPKIKSDESAVIKCILHLLEQAGQDLAAGELVNAYQEYCEANLQRAKFLLDIILSDKSLTPLLAPTLISGSKLDNNYFWNQSIHLIEQDDIEIRSHAIRAIGRLNYDKQSDLAFKALEIIEQHIKHEEDDSCLANALDAICNLKKQNLESDIKIDEVFQKTLRLRGEQTLHAATILINFEHRNLPEEVILIILDALKDVPSKNTGTLERLDFGLSKILCDHRFFPKIVSLLETLILNAQDSFNFDKVFQHTSRTLLNDSEGRLTKLITKWFLTADKRLCKSIQQIISSGHHKNAYLIQTIDNTGLNEMDFVFLARKAIGYLFMYPVTATSYILALLSKSSTDQVKLKLVKLIYEMLQLNFPGEVGEFLKDQTEPEEIKTACVQILKWSEKYFEAIRNMGQVPELLPSQAHREAYMRHFSNKVQQSMKAAEQESPILSMVSKSIIIYGRKSIDYHQSGMGPVSRSETILHHHETGVEVPRSSLIDPVGLDYTLRVYRNEYKKS